MRLLILTCSARKRGAADLLPVLERYDGPLWRVLRSYLQNQPAASDLHIYGLSAAFGLLPGEHPIPHYDQTMSPAQADRLRPAVLETFAGLFDADVHQLCLGLSQRYLRAMTGWEQYVPAHVAVTFTDGTMGTKLGQLRAWLAGRPYTPVTPQAQRLVAPEQPRGAVVIAGVPLRMGREEVLERARVALAADGAGARRFRDWYVLLDDTPVAPKWLVSVLSGLPTSAFDAANARRVLLALGLDVERVAPDDAA